MKHTHISKNANYNDIGTWRTNVWTECLYVDRVSFLSMSRAQNLPRLSLDLDLLRSRLPDRRFLSRGLRLLERLLLVGGDLDLVERGQRRTCKTSFDLKLSVWRCSLFHGVTIIIGVYCILYRDKEVNYKLFFFIFVLFFVFTASTFICNTCWNYINCHLYLMYWTKSMSLT